LITECAVVDVDNGIANVNIVSVGHDNGNVGHHIANVAIVLIRSIALSGLDSFISLFSPT
jgi:hypothetical protein